MKQRARRNKLQKLIAEVNNLREQVDNFEEGGLAYGAAAALITWSSYLNGTFSIDTQ